jgi:thioesterase domain-containing protein
MTELTGAKRALLELRLQQERAKRWSPLVPLQAAGDRRPLFLVHPSSGSAFCYVPLAPRLGVDQPVYGLEAPGFEGDEPSLPSIEAMAASYVAAVRGAQPHGPYLVGGWSNGGVIAFEMARQLAAAGEAVERLFVIDSMFLLPDDPPDPEKALRWMTKDMAHQLGVHTEPDIGDLLALPEAERPAPLRDRLVELGVLPAEIDLATFRRRVEMHRDNALTMARYEPGPYEGPATMIIAQTSGVDLRWRRLLRQGFDLHVVPGTHHYLLLQAPKVDELAALLRGRLDGTAPAGDRVAPT